LAFALAAGFLALAFAAFLGALRFTLDLAFRAGAAFFLATAFFADFLALDFLALDFFAVLALAALRLVFFFDFAPGSRLLSVFARSFSAMIVFPLGFSYDLETLCDCYAYWPSNACGTGPPVAQSISSATWTTGIAVPVAI